MIRLSGNVFLRRLGATTILLLLAIGTLSAQAAVTPEKSPNDAHHYRVITLPNQLKALLISDPSTDMAAAAMDVATGSGDDPVDRPGLAHFTEHMLFLGTRKYPAPDAYQQFISAHGGDHNAMTMFEHTNYFFDINADALAPALDRFAQQFTAPLFNPSYVEREKHAVSSEYSAKKQSDSRRFYSAFRQALNPAHPYSHFSVGNLTTLADRPNDKVRDDLLRFYQAHYSANLMTLVVYGKQSLDQLEALIRERFSHIPNRHLKRSQYTMPLFKPGSQPQLLRVQSLKETRQLQLSFPIPSTRDQYGIKPTSYIANLLGHEGRGSLLYVLKKAGWVDGLSAGAGLDTGHQALMEINMSLTPEGLKHWKDIVALTFDAIDKIREDGIRKLYYQENARLSQIAFRFQEQSEPIHLVSRLATELQDVKAQDVLKAPYMLTHYAPDAYRAILDKLTPANLTVAILSPQALPKGAPKTQWYDTPYSVEPLDMPELLKQSQAATLASQLALPTANPFIPDRLSLVSGATMTRPEKLLNNPVTLWYARDKRFGTPKANIYLNLRSPVANASPRDAVLSKLMVALVMDQLDAYAYPAQLAGLDYDVYHHLRGISVRVGGYDDKLHLLLTKVLQAIAHPSLKEERFRIERQQLIDNLRNSHKAIPYQQAMNQTQHLLISNLWSSDQQLAAARKVTFTDLKAYATGFSKQLHLVMLAHGNLTAAGALNMAQTSQAILLGNSERVDVPRSQIHALPAKADLHFDWPVDHPDTAYVRYIQGRNNSDAERARFLLMGQMLSSPFYNALRTQQQLGYIVFATPFPILKTPALALIIESPKASASTIDKQVALFMAGYADKMASMSPEAFQQQKTAVITNLRQKPKRLGDVTERYWRDIDEDDAGFDLRERMVNAVSAIRQADLVRYYRQNIAPERRSLTVVTGRAIPTTGNATVEKALKQGRYIQD